MRFKTTIEIISEAEDKNEAMDIVGEYLSGNLVSGVDMKCLTRPAVNYKRNVLAGLAVSVLALVFFVVTLHVKPSQNSIPNISGTAAIQPPLKTYGTDNKNTNFKKEWQDIQTKKALNSLKR